MASGPHHPYAGRVDSDVITTIATRDGHLTELIKSMRNNGHRAVEDHPHHDSRVTASARDQRHLAHHGPQHKVAEYPFDAERDEAHAEQLVRILEKFHCRLDLYPYTWACKTIEQQSCAMLQKNGDVREALQTLVEENPTLFKDIRYESPLHESIVKSDEAALWRLENLFPDLTFAGTEKVALDICVALLTGNRSHILKAMQRCLKTKPDTEKSTLLESITRGLKTFRVMQQSLLLRLVIFGIAEALGYTHKECSDYAQDAQNSVLDNLRTVRLAVRNRCLSTVRMSVLELRESSPREVRRKNATKEMAELLAETLKLSPHDDDDIPFATAVRNDDRHAYVPTGAEALEDLAITLDQHPEVFKDLVYKPPPGVHDRKMRGPERLTGRNAALRRLELLCPILLALPSRKMTRDFEKAIKEGRGDIALKVLQDGNFFPHEDILGGSDGFPHGLARQGQEGCRTVAHQYAQTYLDCRCLLYADRFAQVEDAICTGLGVRNTDIVLEYTPRHHLH